MDNIKVARIEIETTEGITSQFLIPYYDQNGDDVIDEIFTSLIKQFDEVYSLVVPEQ